MNALHRPASPVDLVILGLPDASAGAALASSIADVVDNGSARVLDALWIRKDADGTSTVIDIDDDDGIDLFGFDTWLPGLLGAEDVDSIAAELPVGTAAAVIAWENVWAAGVSQTVADAGGVLLAHDRIPAAAVDELLDMLASSDDDDDEAGRS